MGGVRADGCMVAELVVALLITVIVAGSMLALLDTAHRRLTVQVGTAELYQRARTMLVRLHRDLQNAGVPSDDLRSSAPRRRPAVVPTGNGGQLPHSPRSVDTYDPTSLTLVQIDPEDTVVLEGTLDPSAGALVQPDGRCPTWGEATCRFRPGALGLMGDATGRTDLVRVVGLDRQRLWLAAPDGGDAPTYGAGSTMVPATIRTYRFDRSRFQLRSRVDEGLEVPVLNNVVGVTFTLFGSAAASSGEGDVSARIDRCRGLHAGSIGLPPSVLSDVELTRDLLSDGPWCGTTRPYDADLLRVRRVRVEVTFDASRADLRGDEPRLFRRPGLATGPARWVPDVTARLDVAIHTTGGS